MEYVMKEISQEQLNFILDVFTCYRTGILTAAEVQRYVLLSAHDLSYVRG